MLEKPYEDLYILKIKDKFRRCDACMKKYRHLADTICDECPLNPIKSEEDRVAFIKDAFDNPTDFV